MRINFLALDFDLTLLNFHTGGRPWNNSISEMGNRIRPMFLYLIPAAHAAGIKIAVVTFSPQVKTISRVLEHLFPDIAGQIPIRGHDRSWSVETGTCMDGKQPHMASAVEELYTIAPHIEITRKTTLLVDDDRNNIRHAFRNKVRAIWLDPSHPHRFFDDLKEMI